MPTRPITGSSPATRGQGYNERVSPALARALARPFIVTATADAAGVTGLPPTVLADTNTVQETRLTRPTARQFNRGKSNPDGGTTIGGGY